MVATRVGQHVTWFLPKPWRWADPQGHVWHDGGAEANGEGPYASGLPIETPGIALPNNGDSLGGYWHVLMPRMNIEMVVRQVDVGPNKPVIDLSAPLAFLLFTTPGDVPDYTPWSAEFIGHELSPDVRAGITNTRTHAFIPLYQEAA